MMFKILIFKIGRKRDREDDSEDENVSRKRNVIKLNISTIL